LTPFSTIGLQLQVLQRDVETFLPRQRDVLDELMTEISTLHRLITGVVRFAGLVHKQREPQPGEIALNHLIPATLQPLAILAQGREVDFRVLIPEDLPRVYADPELAGEAVFQMAHNAIKFNVPGGRAQVRAVEQEDWVTIEVTDTGRGLTEERITLLGKPFEQEADALLRGREGLGVGWAFVRYVAEAHAGWTQVQSPGVDQGSTFSLVLPKAAQGRAG
jgi:signal transduction histidine kinase